MDKDKRARRDPCQTGDGSWQDFRPRGWVEFSTKKSPSEKLGHSDWANTTEPVKAQRIGGSRGTRGVPSQDITEARSIEARWALTGDGRTCEWAAWLDQSWANYGLRAHSSQPPIFINKLLLKHSHDHLFTCCPWLLLVYEGRVE